MLPPHVQRHFKRVDPTLYAAIRPDTSPEWSRPAEPFAALARIVIGQQVSTGAARAIYARFAALFSRRTPTPRKLAALSDATLRGAGLSGAKVKTLRALAAHYLAHPQLFKTLKGMESETLIAELTSIHGIGPWTAEMFLMFHAGHEDIFSAGDLGLRKAMMRLYGLPAMPTPAEMEEISNRWKPYRTYACRILWASIDG